jgi:antitoxin (DNA-binding transcriptional repressor) of toxin-antitoxin stability system
MRSGWANGLPETRFEPAKNDKMWPHVAILTVMTSTGIRELKDNLSRFIRRIEAGERIAITAHGRVVAELVPPGTKMKGGGPSRFDELVAAGVIRPPLEAGDPTEDWPEIRLPPGTAAELIDADRGQA